MRTAESLRSSRPDIVRRGTNTKDDFGENEGLKAGAEAFANFIASGCLTPLQ